MRILVISQNYFPEPVNVWTQLCEALQARGNDVTVVTGYPNWPKGVVYAGHRISLHQIQIIRGVRVIRVPLYPYHGRSSLRRIINYLSFMGSSMALGPWGRKRPHVIFAIQPPTVCIPAWLFSRIWQVPFIYDLEDMWPETLVATRMMSNPALLSMVGKFCNWVYKRASGIRIISKGFASNLLGKGVPADKLYYIPNWVDTEFYRPQTLDADVRRHFALTGFTIILYAGTIGLAQGLDTVLDAAALLRNLSDVQFVLAGDGIDLLRLKKRAETMSLANVKFLGRQPTEMMPALYAASSILLVHLKDDPLFRITIPHKTLTYLSSGKPVLAAVQGDVADVVREAGAGLTCPSENPKALAEAISSFCCMTKEERNKMGEKGRRFALEHFRKDQIVDQLLEMFIDIGRKTNRNNMQS